MKIIKIQILKKKSTWPTCCVFLVNHGVIFTRQLTASHCFTQHSNFFFFCFLFLCSNCHQVLNIKNHQQQSCRPYYLVNKISMVPSSVSLSLLIKRMYRIFNFFFFVYRMIDKSLSLHERTWTEMGSSNCLFDLILLLSSWNTDQL